MIDRTAAIGRFLPFESLRFKAGATEQRLLRRLAASGAPEAGRSRGRPATLREQLARIAERAAHRRRGDGVGRAEIDVRGRIAHAPLEVARDAGDDVDVRPEAVAVARAGAAGGGEEFR